MKTKKGFYTYSVCGESLIMAEGVENIDFNSIISINETARYLWEQVEGKEFTIDDMVEALLKEYEVDEATARTDCEALAKQWLEAGIISE